MRPYPLRAGLGIAATAVFTLSGISAASAATPEAPRTVVPRTLPAPCTSRTAWLKLSAAIGERCYTGNGTIVVNLAGVRAGQIVGRHTVCLVTTPILEHCATGPVTFLVTPPALVRSVSIRTP